MIFVIINIALVHAAVRAMRQVNGEGFLCLIYRIILCFKLTSF